MESRKERLRKKRTFSWKKARRILFGFMLFILCVITLGLGTGVGLMASMVKDQPLETKEEYQRQLNSLFQTSYAYFQPSEPEKQPKQIGALRFDNDRNLIGSIDQVNPYLKKAFISIEDRSFYEHDGIVPRSIARAALQQVTDSEVETGGSTITQQLVKLMILNDRSKDIERKAKEIVLALRLERFFTKDEIFLYYMNSVFFGEGAHGRKMYGISSAAKGLFNKDQKDLNLPQAAYIAGMVQRPNDLNPFSEDPKNLERGMKRMKLVLDKMLETGAINQKEYEAALQFDIQKSFAKSEMFDNSYERYPFIMYALETEAAELLMEIDGLDAKKLSEQGKYRVTLEEYKKKAVTGGYRFYTTIDETLYNAINKDAFKGVRFHERTYKGETHQETVGAVVMDNHTGAILAFVSGSEDFAKNQKDHALFVSRQPGSTIKPILDYGPALEERLISPNSKIVDEEIRKSDGSGFYRNANRKYKGPVTVKEAIKWSYNIPAIKTFNALGHQKGFDYIEKMGLYVDQNDGESAAIGGFTKGFTVRQMTGAFAVLGNGGEYNEPYIISKVTDADGNVIWQHQAKPQRVFSPQTSYQLTKMLETVLDGTGGYIGQRIPRNYAVAGKTGTTSSDRDLWFVGYTPNISIGVWAGYDYNHRLSHNPDIAKKTWVNIFNSATDARPDLFPKDAQFISPGNLPSEICGFDCGSVQRFEQRKLQEELKKRLEEREKEKEKEEEEEEQPKEEEEDKEEPGITLPFDPDLGDEKPKKPWDREDLDQRSSQNMIIERRRSLLS